MLFLIEVEHMSHYHPLRGRLSVWSPRSSSSWQVSQHATVGGLHGKVGCGQLRGEWGEKHLTSRWGLSGLWVGL